MRAFSTFPVLAVTLAACQPVQPVGYVEVKRSFMPGPGDTYRLNGLALAELKRNASMVIRQNTGAVRLELDRAGLLLPLCNFDVGKNRIITANLQVVDGKIKCSVQG